MNTSQIENASNPEQKWSRVKQEIISLWSSVNGDELDRTRGNIKEIANLIHTKYGAAKKAVIQKVTDVYRKYEFTAQMPNFSTPRA